MMSAEKNWGRVMQRNAARARSRVELAPVCQPDERSELQRIIELLLGRIRLAVIFGGNKSAPGSVIYQSQNTRSWKSYEAVAEDIAASLRRCGFRHVDLIPEDMSLPERIRGGNIHMAWLNTGGVQGQSSMSHAAAMLEMLGVPYVGHEPLSAATLDNKHAFKRGAVCAGLPTAPFVTWHMSRGTFRPDCNSRFKQAFGNHRGPFVVKPVSGRASLHVHVVPDVEALPAAIEQIYEITGNLVLIEKFLPGREFCISVAGPITTQSGQIFRGREPFAFGALERVLMPGELIFTSMDSRPITASRFKQVSPLEEQLWSDMHRLAREVYLEFNLGSLIRLDLRTDEGGKLCILEANPKPDLKSVSAGVTSLVSAGLAQTNLQYDDLILSLFADRLNHLLRHRSGSMKHIVELIPAGAVDLSEFNLVATKLEKDVDWQVNALAEKARRMGV
jgi:D-alanine-D-alanine ligase